MDAKDKFLLPPGFRDLLSDEAEKEFSCTRQFIDNFHKWGYSLVSTPLLEFEESAFYGSGEALAPRTLKLADPLSQKTLCIRADITTQISRLIESRISNPDLPLRLCYFGDVVRASSQNTRKQRQLKQIGIELVDKNITPEACAETAIIAIESLIEAGIKDLSIDINTPSLINKLGIEISDELKSAIDKKDISKLPQIINELIKISGNADKAFAGVSKSLGKEALAQIEFCKKVYDEIKATNLPINVTVDFVENRGFEYHDVFSFSIFAKNIRDEIGRGGKYTIGNLSGVGCTIYLSAILDAAPSIKTPNIQEVSLPTNYSEIKKMQEKGIITRKRFN